MSRPVEAESAVAMLGNGAGGDMKRLAKNEYRVYKKRWLVLASVSLINLSNAMVWF